jgi:tetratricopeptide (TPR) repeat protein
LNFFLVGVNFKRRSARAEERVQKVISQLGKRFPSLIGRIAHAPFFAPPVEGLLISPPKENPISPELIQDALAEMGYTSTVQGLNSDGMQPDSWIDPESLRLLESGKSFCRLGLLEEARIQLQHAIQRDPACVEAYHYLTAVLKRQGKAKEAAQWLRVALESAPQEASIHFLYADLCHQVGESGDAVLHLKEAIRLKPEASSPYVKLGEVFQRLGQSDQARLAFEEGLARDPNSADAAAGLGSLLLGEGRLTPAIDYLQKALQENDELHETRLQLGWCLFHTGRPRQAEVEFLRVAREADETFLTAAKFSLGRLYSHLGDHIVAAELLTEVLAKQPDLAEAHHLLAQSLCQLEQFETALEHWMETLKLQPQRQAELRPQLALCYSRLEKHHVAEKLARQALDELGPRANLYELLASVYMAQDEWEQALVALRKGEVLEPDSALIAFQIGWVHENLDQHQEAEEYYSRALRLDPAMVEAYSGLGWLFYEREQYDVALVLFEKAYELDPENPEMADHVGWAHLLLQHPGQALNYFREALAKEPYSDFYRTHLAAALFHLQRYEDCKSTLEVLKNEPLDEFLSTFTDYLLDQVRRELGEPTRALSAKRLKLLPQEFVALTSSGRNLSRAKKWTEFRGKKGESKDSAKRSSR